MSDTRFDIIGPKGGAVLREIFRCGVVRLGAHPDKENGDGSAGPPMNCRTLHSSQASRCAAR